MAIKVIPDGSRKGGGGMDIGKTPKKRPSTGKMKKEKPASRVSDQDVKRIALEVSTMLMGGGLPRRSTLLKAFGLRSKKANPSGAKKAGGGKVKKKK